MMAATLFLEWKCKCKIRLRSSLCLANLDARLTIFLFGMFFSFSCSYLLPLAVALGSYIVRLLFDWTCSPWSDICKNSSDLLSHISAVVLFFLVIVASTKAKQIGDFVKRLQTMFEAMNNGPAAPTRGGAKAKAD